VQRNQKGSKRDGKFEDFGFEKKYDGKKDFPLKKPYGGGEGSYTKPTREEIQERIRNAERKLNYAMQLWQSNKEAKVQTDIQQLIAHDNAYVGIHEAFVVDQTVLDNVDSWIVDNYGGDYAYAEYVRRGIQDYKRDKEMNKYINSRVNLFEARAEFLKQVLYLLEDTQENRDKFNVRKPREPR